MQYDAPKTHALTCMCVLQNRAWGHIAAPEAEPMTVQDARIASQSLTATQGLKAPRAVCPRCKMGHGSTCADVPMCVAGANSCARSRAHEGAGSSHGSACACRADGCLALARHPVAATARAWPCVLRRLVNMLACCQPSGRHS